MQDDEGIRFIRNLYVTCSFPERDDALAASDTCQKPAPSGVKAPDGNIYWRCREHEGMVDATTRGEAVFTLTGRKTS
jgi:hypothetical protein